MTLNTILFATLTALVRSPDLTLISVWSPTFLIMLLDALPQLAEPLMRALHDTIFCQLSTVKWIVRAR